MSDEVAILKRHLARERAARKQAEELLDSKTLDLHQANQELSEATETLKSLVSSRTAIISNLITNLSSGILLENELGEIMFANQVFCDLFEISVPPDKLIGKKLSRRMEDFEAIFSEPDHEFDKLKKLLSADKKVLNVPIELRSGRTIECDYIPIEIMSVQKGRLGQFRDITEKKKDQLAIESSEKRFKLLAEYHEHIRGADLTELLDKTISFLKSKVGLEQVYIFIVNPKNTDLSQWLREAVRKLKTADVIDNPEATIEEVNPFNFILPLVMEGEDLGSLRVLSKQDQDTQLESQAMLRLLEPQLTYALKNLMLIQDLETSKEIITQSEEKYRGIMENMELGLMEVTNDDTILKVYDRFCKMTGYQPEELIGRNANEMFLLPEYEHVLEEQHVHREKGVSSVYEVEIPLKNGERKWVLISGAPFYDSAGKKLGSIGIHLDISDRKRMEQNLLLAKAEAEKAQEAEKIFLANMSHEIRNPLNAVIGMTHLLEDTHPTAEQNEYLGYIRNSSETLLNLISDILDLSKIHANEISFSPAEISLKKLLRDIQSLFEVRCLEQGIGFRFQYDAGISDRVIGDQLILHQILNNLLGNALKFTEEGGTISLKVDLIHEKHEQYDVEFIVEDSGIGIKPGHLTTIFEEFKQADGNTKIKYGGTGLGLSISKKLVMLHGGSIVAESEEGKGSTFRVQIPFERTHAIDREEPEKRREEDGAIEIGEVLIVEDNPINRKYLSRTLQKWQINCDQAVNGLEALKKLEAKAYDLLIMDIRMPEMDGYQAIEKIRKHPNDKIRHITAIALTADAMREEREKAYNLGFNYHITKPFRSEDLREKLVEVMELAAINETPNSDSPELKIDPYFDQGALNAIYEGDQEYMIEMFKVFEKNTPRELESLEHSISQQNWNETRSILHRCKPTFEMVGMPALTKKAGQLEEEYEQQGLFQIEELQQFTTEAKGLLKKISIEIEKTNTP